jgi:signal transduction histidine kinase/CheY-like chemotaxis protein/AraC-like DNA-binding protein
LKIVLNYIFLFFNTDFKKQKAIYFSLFCFLFLGPFNFHGQSAQLEFLSKRSKDLIASSNYDSALIYADKLFTEAEKNRSVKYSISAYRDKAFIYSNTGKTKEAFGMYYNALKLCKDTSQNKLKALIYNGLGNLNYHQNDVPAAKNCYKQELYIRQQIGDPSALGDTYINLSGVYTEQHDFDSAQYMLEKVRAILNKTNNIKQTGYYFLQKGILFQGLNAADSAIGCYKKSLGIWMRLNNKKEAVKLLYNIGFAYFTQKQYERALEYYLKAKDLIETLDSPYETIRIYGTMAELYFIMGNYKASAEYYSNYLQLKGSFQDKEIKNYAVKLEKQFQLQKNTELIHQQKLEIAQQEALINQQQKRYYLFLFLIVSILGIALLIIIYFNFKKQLRITIEESKKKFFSNVVHEIRTPLTMIQAPLKVLKAKATSPDDLFHIELADRNVKRLNELIDQMLDISKIEQISYKLNESVGDLELFFTQLLNTYTKIASEKNISLLHQFTFENKILFFDKDALEKIAGNLLSNAIKYTPNNGQVGINSITEETEEGTRLIINVWDTGIGIREKDQEKIFSRFYRTEETATTTKGMGIGLSLVKDLVDLQKGKITVQSTQGKGSLFKVVLELKRNFETAIPVSEQSDDEALILLIEDDVDILDFNTKLLEQRNYRVLKARDGKEALDLIEKTLPDLIISDIMMPGMDGLTFLKAVKNNSTTDHIPVIVLSAKSAAGSRLEALKEGAQGYLSKPFLPDELITLVSNQLEILSKRKTEFVELIAQPEKSVEEKFVGSEPYTQKLFALIFKHFEDSELTVEKLADMMSTNRSHFQRKIKSITGFSPSELIKNIRLEKAKELLLNRSGNITEIAYQVGFSSQSYFTKCFSQHFGISPSQLLQGNTNA